jgi:hypothetical protein
VPSTYDQEVAVHSEKSGADPGDSGPKRPGRPGTRLAGGHSASHRMTANRACGPRSGSGHGRIVRDAADRGHSRPRSTPVVGYPRR